MLPDAICAVCKNQPETVENLFLLCPWSRQIWENSDVNISIVSQEMPRLEAWLANFTHIVVSFELLSLSLWQIWKTRNNYVFRHKILDPQQIPDSAKAMHRNLNRWVQVQKKPSKQTNAPHIWQAPAPSVAKGKRRRILYTRNRERHDGLCVPWQPWDTASWRRPIGESLLYNPS